MGKSKRVQRRLQRSEDDRGAAEVVDEGCSGSPAKRPQLDQGPSNEKEQVRVMAKEEKEHHRDVPQNGEEQDQASPKEEKQLDQDAPKEGKEQDQGLPTEGENLDQGSSKDTGGLDQSLPREAGEEKEVSPKEKEGSIEAVVEDREEEQPLVVHPKPKTRMMQQFQSESVSNGTSVGTSRQQPANGSDSGGDQAAGGASADEADTGEAVVADGSAATAEDPVAAEAKPLASTVKPPHGLLMPPPPPKETFPGHDWLICLGCKPAVDGRPEFKWYTTGSSSRRRHWRDKPHHRQVHTGMLQDETIKKMFILYLPNEE